MWAYHTLAEYCEVNGQDGYQAGADTILSFATWNQVTWNAVTYGVASEVSVFRYYLFMFSITGPL